MHCLFRLAGTPDVQNVFLIGEFNGWSSTAEPMLWVDDRWQAIVEIPPGDYRYAYLLVHAAPEGPPRVEVSCPGSNLHVPLAGASHAVQQPPEHEAPLQN